MSTLTINWLAFIKLNYRYQALLIVIIVLSLGGITPTLADQKPTLPLLHHDLTVIPDLAQGQLVVHDSITLPSALKQPSIVFTLNRHMTVTIDQTILQPVQSNSEFSVYRLNITDYSKPLQLSYQGKLSSTPNCNWLSETCRMLNDQGLYLDPASYWYVDMEQVLHTFKLHVELPTGWLSVAQGINQKTTWQESQPQTGIYLVAAPFKAYHRTQKGIEYSVYLRHDDKELANRYLDSSAKHLQTLQTLLGTYPYTKFAVVESFWETGWSMPSFTLLGSQVMRLPFILNSSLPHEIAHNWWGNSVYINTDYGNWSEGLTAYLTDHYQSILSGDDINYRRNQLIKLSTYLTQSAPTPLSTFTSRHDQASQALGYSKSLMLFHMLYKELGEETFLKALQTFYQRYSFDYATFKQLEQVFSEISHRDLSTFFKQWRDDTTLPQLQLTEAKVLEPKRVSFTIKQTFPAFHYPLTLPILINSRSTRPEWSTVTLTAPEQTFVLSTFNTPHDLIVDPYFDVLRLPLAQETPPTLDYFFNSNTSAKTIVIAHQARPEMLTAWKNLAKEWPNWTLQLDNQPIPEGDIILLGGESDWIPKLVEQTQAFEQLNQINDMLGRENYFCGLHTLALVMRLQDRQVLSLSADHVEGLKRLVAKLPHYGSYSYALFNSTNGNNIAKGYWDVLDSPLRKDLTSN
ncbi:MAG: hypothetical protein RLZZ422_1425 [Pseudomonadota bacterium]|jgi:hypothetical protein